MIDQAILTELKDQMLVEKARIEKTLKDSGEMDTDIEDNFKSDFPEYGSDEESNAMEVADYSDTIAVEHKLEKKLAEINAALARMEKGSCGTCEETGEEIPLERLKAFPAARTCVK